MTQYWNRATGQLETEAVYGGDWVRWLYGNKLGQGLAEAVLSRHWVSKLYGNLQSSSRSRAKIEPFVREFKIKMEEFGGTPYHTFNEFFTRPFKPGARKFVTEPGRMPAFAEARYLGFEKVTTEQTFPVKGSALSAAAILGDEVKARPFTGGSVLIARLCPTDYHRYHYPDDGRTLEHFSIPGALHSVNPLAIRYKNEIFFTNERRVSLLETRSFGRLAYVEVGALCVGRIVQTHPEDREFARGAEKGYFLFGASTVIVLGEPGRWRPDEDLLEFTAQGQEVLVRLGEGIAKSRI